jgi:hypothetical protein
VGPGVGRQRDLARHRAGLGIEPAQHGPVARPAVDDQREQGLIRGDRHRERGPSHVVLGQAALGPHHEAIALLGLSLDPEAQAVELARVGRVDHGALGLQPRARALDREAAALVGDGPQLGGGVALLDGDLAERRTARRGQDALAVVRARGVGIGLPVRALLDRRALDDLVLALAPIGAELAVVQVGHAQQRARGRVSRPDHHLAHAARDHGHRGEPAQPPCGQRVRPEEGDRRVVRQEAALLERQRDDLAPVAVGHEAHGLLEGPSELGLQHRRGDGQLERTLVGLLLAAGPQRQKDGDDPAADQRLASHATTSRYLSLPGSTSMMASVLDTDWSTTSPR